MRLACARLRAAYDQGAAVHKQNHERILSAATGLIRIKARPGHAAETGANLTKQWKRTMRKTPALLLSSLAAALALAASPAMAQSKGDWTLGVGAHNVDPKSSAGDLNGSALGLGALPTKVDSSVRPTVTFEYFVADKVGVEVLAALPFQHDISIDGVGTVGRTKQLPPVVSLQYHFANSSKVTPFVGLGVNYTKFFSTDSKGALKGTKLKLEDSWGLAAHAGLDFALTDKDALRVDLRWADIDTKVKVNGHKLGTANIDPLVYGVAYVRTF